jgi:hypothetical protein
MITATNFIFKRITKWQVNLRQISETYQAAKLLQQDSFQANLTSIDSTAVTFADNIAYKIISSADKPGFHRNQRALFSEGIQVHELSITLLTNHQDSLFIHFPNNETIVPQTDTYRVIMGKITTVAKQDTLSVDFYAVPRNVVYYYERVNHYENSKN